MENNTPQPPPVTTTPPAASQPVAEAPAQAAPPVVPPAHRKSKFGILFIILFILGILFLGGTYLFVSMEKKSTTAMPIVNKSAQMQKDVHQLEEQVPADDTKTMNTDFTQVDQEMKNL